MNLEFFNIIEKEQEYKKYLMFHIEHVEEAYHRLIEPLLGKYDKAVDDAVLLCGQYIPLHDLSKLSKYEFDDYRQFYYPTDEEKKFQDKNEKKADAIKKAWEHHYQNNPHHPLYWVKDGIKQDMPLNFIFEMFCDWSSVGQWFGTSTITWYDTSAVDEKAAFSDNTREQVEKWFDIIFRVPGIKF